MSEINPGIVGLIKTSAYRNTEKCIVSKYTKFWTCFAHLIGQNW